MGRHPIAQKHPLAKLKTKIKFSPFGGGFSRLRHAFSTLLISVPFVATDSIYVLRKMPSTGRLTIQLGRPVNSQLDCQPTNRRSTHSTYSHVKHANF